ncbi:pseudouridine synthase [Rhodocyclus tenuis]|uniref:Pseudouridine synthase n=1 Tax=Rhodocyclus tenuis TaxID=1066 RepID=A0A840GHT8_RHOTE|nr:pseudouridine synthase [Rhodocyclus tenuis]MBB4247749.1 23S rRNA pseudouridine2457 synthase [Rhodocyclus tenuis]
MSRIVLFNKPYGVLSQFTAEGRWPGLAGYIALPGVYVAGRLDADSEGLLLLTDDGALQARIADPRYKLAKTYWVQVEGEPDEAALAALRRGVCYADFTTRPAAVRRIPEPELPPREPPIRFRRDKPTSWLEIIIREGRNRQVRRMTASVGFPTLRLFRYAVGPATTAGLAPGEWRLLTAAELGLPPLAPLADSERRQRVARSGGQRRPPAAHAAGPGTTPPRTKRKNS